MGEKKRTGAVFIFLLLAVVLVAQLAGNMTRSSDVSYGEMREYFTEEKVRSFTAVSYTHLDVYKRQVCLRRGTFVTSDKSTQKRRLKLRFKTSSARCALCQTCLIFLA